MARVKIQIDTDNAAFDDENLGPEVARILQDLADRIQVTGAVEPQNLRDLNGNTIGYVALYQQREKQ